MSTSNSNLTSDRTYTLLLSHLHNPHTSLSLPTLQSALSHHLALLPPCTSSPTPLAATAISAPYYLVQPFTFTKLNSLSTSFRHAVHLKFRALKEEWEARGRIERLFNQSVGGSLDAWAKEVVKGLIGGHPVLRLACCSGLLLGIEDLGKKELDVALGARGVVEDEDIVALAEVMDTYAFSVTGGTHGVEEWEKEFQPAGQDVLSMALILAAQSVPLIPHSKLKALPLPLLSHLLTQTLLATFKHGSFLSSVSASVTLTPNNEVHISASSAFAHTVRSITSSPLTAHISDLARFMASVLSLLLPSSSVGTVAQTMEALRDCAKAIERDWISTSLASVPGVATDTQDLTKAVWGILKTFLFTVLMVDDAALSAAVFIPPESSGAADLALTTLETLSHLAFVITQFGGVTSTSTNSFLELKKTFYLALDILAQTQSRAETYVERVCGGALEMRRGEGNVGFRQAKEAFVLAAVEQLVPVLGAKCLRESVWRVCEPHLFDASHRETFESAHSTVLAVFASHSQRTRAETPKASDSSRAWLDRLGQRAGLVLGYSRKRETLSVGEDDEQHENERTNDDEFVMRLVPFYAGCLLENSREGKLNTAQLRMAYAALVRGACACDSPMDGEGKGRSCVLAWYCVQRLLDAIHALEGRDAKGKGKEVGREEGHEERLHRLRLVLMSTVSALPLVLLAQALEEVRLVLLRSKEGLSHSGVADLQHSANSITVPVTSEQAEGMAKEERHEELVQALFAEILENVGDREKEWAGRWWYEHRGEFGIVGEPDLGRGVGDEKSTGEGERARL
ncbi:hypothetical protein DFP72DRAFT_306958 [Ephemerocybe angulata]|uniref:Uncharacterized protein n=1 Tax=Ephemerocybe angulata TaxID=980116 RepID=A0A8H6I257_9AGAR|nr:hypothetical protein DFP72DRAFT_306958 [Tulosesus angulatus]